MTDDPGCAALLVIDLQNAFCAATGSLAPDPETLVRYRSVIAQTALMVATARRRGVRVVYLRHVYRRGFPEAYATMPFLDRLRAGGALLHGTDDTQLVAPLDLQDGDILVDKSRFDGFQDTGLDGVLRAGGVRELIVAGVSTNVCVESSVRSGAERGYRMYVAADATAATTEELHEASLRSMAYAFAVVAPWRTLPWVGSGRDPA